jgi:hypothetical protein
MTYEEKPRDVMTVNGGYDSSGKLSDYVRAYALPQKRRVTCSFTPKFNGAAD